MPGLFRNRPDTREGKYPVLLRRDGTVPEWEWFVLGQRDPAAIDAIRAYADSAERRGFDPVYVSDLRAMADAWTEAQASEAWRRSQGEESGKPADPDGPRHRKDDPDVIAFPSTLTAFKERVAADGAKAGAGLLVEEIMAAAVRYSTMTRIAIQAAVLSGLESMAKKYGEAPPEEPRSGGSA